MQNVDHNIGFWLKNANFFAENCQKSQKIVIITSTPGFEKGSCGSKLGWDMIYCSVIVLQLVLFRRVWRDSFCGHAQKKVDNMFEAWGQLKPASVVYAHMCRPPRSQSYDFGIYNYYDSVG
jgi:hypothetical protein